METLNWDNIEEIDRAKQFFDQYISSWNPRLSTISSQSISQTNVEDPCLLSTSDILRKNPFNDYVQLINCIERHTKCTENTCLIKGSSFECRYKEPWELHPHSSLVIDSNGQNTYTHARNDDRLNTHNPTILSIWHANVD